MSFPADSEILDRIKEAVFSLDKKWRFTYLNKTAVKMLYLPQKREDIIGKNMWEMLPQLKTLSHYREIKNILKHRKPVCFDTISPLSHKWRHFAFYPGKNGITVILRNIEKVKAFEKELLQEKQWSYDILESIQDGMVVVDRSLTYLYVNREAEKIIGIPAKKLLGKKFIDEFPDHNLDIISLLQVIKNAWLQRKIASLEIFFKPLDAWFALTVYPFEDKFSVIFRDITQTKRLEEELYGSQAKLDAIFKNISDEILIQDNQGNLIYANDAAARACGYKNAQQMPIGVPFDYTKKFDLFDLENRHLEGKDLPARQVLSGKLTEAEVTLMAVDKSTKKVTWATVKTAGVAYTNGKQKYIINIIRDISDLKESEQEKDDFLSMVSHELKTPLTSMKVYLQLLMNRSKQINDTVTGTIITKVGGNLDKLTELVRALLEVSRTKEGKLRLHKKIFSLPYLLREVMEDIQPITEHKITVSDSTRVILYADRERIAQVLINLVMNAIKYSENAERIALHYVQEKNRIVISVVDKGSGISEKEQGEIFKRFYQSRKHKTFPGLGLGLYISSEIVKAHGGDIWVQSIEGKGSTFSFSLPHS